MDPDHQALRGRTSVAGLPPLAVPTDENVFHRKTRVSSRRVRAGGESIPLNPNR
jgi:hypothetical protein